MNLRFPFSSLVALAAFAPTLTQAASTATCGEQAPCIEFTVNKIANSCNLGGECQVEVCFKVSGSLGAGTDNACGKGGSDSFSHMCMQSDATEGCPLWTDDGKPKLGWGDSTVCTETGEGAMTGAFDGKCSANDVDMCQEGKPGDTLYWILKDGSNSTLEDETFSKSFTVGDGSSCSVDVRCWNGEYNCGETFKAQQSKFERTWSFTIPSDSGTCDVCSTGTPTTPSAPIAPITPTSPTTPTGPTSDQEPSGSRGDPHFKTWIGEHFEFHGQCDLVLAKDPSFANDLGLEVQIRTKIVRYWSYIKRAAIRIGDDILEVEGTVDMSETKPNYWINFGFQKELTTLGGFPVEVITGKANSRKHHFIIDLSSKYPGVKINLSSMKEFVKVDFIQGTEDAFGNAVGMMGDFKTGKMLARDRATEIEDFNAFGNEWQIQPMDTMLFHDVSDPQFPKRCVLPEDPQGQRRRRLDESSVSIEDAEKACAKLTDELDRKECVYDIIATQDMDMAGAY